MSPTSYQLLYSAISNFVVPVTGLEPVQYRYREILSLLCLPFHHTGSLSASIKIPYPRPNVNPAGQKTYFFPSTAFAATLRATSPSRMHILTKDQKGGREHDQQDGRYRRHDLSGRLVPQRQIGAGAKRDCPALLTPAPSRGKLWQAKRLQGPEAGG